MINEPAIEHLRQSMKSETCSQPQIHSSKSQQGRGSLVLPLHQHGPKQALSSTTGATAHVRRSNLGYQFHTAISPEQHVAGSLLPHKIIKNRCSYSAAPEKYTKIQYTTGTEQGGSGHSPMLKGNVKQAASKVRRPQVAGITERYKMPPRIKLVSRQTPMQQADQFR